MSRNHEKKQQTCYAIDACTQDQIIDIFEESFGYLTFIEKFVERIKKEPIDYNTDHIASSTRPLIILDIDNTLLYCRYFADEICVHDNITYYYNGIDETSGTVTSVWYRLQLELSDDDLIDEYGTDMIEYDHCHTEINRLKKKKTFTYPYKIDDKTNEILDSRETLIKDVKVIGCEISYELNFKINHKFISFQDDSVEIEKFLPSLTRKGYDDAAFIYNGFIVRCRYGLEDFLESLDGAWDIVLFTAASGDVYKGMTAKLHEYLCDIMGRDTEDKIWKHILFRDDCNYDYDSNGKLFHHKDLTKFNKDLSQVIILDNSELAYKSLEPNAILIKDYMGKDKIDNELDVVLEKLDEIIDVTEESEDKYIDFRYILTGIKQIPNDLKQYDRQLPNDILLSTQRFLNDLKVSLMERNLLPNTLKFSAPSLMNTDMHMELNLIQTSETDEIKADDDIAILTENKNKTDSARNSKKGHLGKGANHSYSISIKLQDIPHFNIDFEMNNLTPINDNFEDYDYGDDDDITTDEEYESDDEKDEKNNARDMSKMKRTKTQKRISFSMKPRPDNVPFMSVLPSKLLQTSMHKIVAYHQNDDKKVDEIKKRISSSRPVPAPPPKQVKRVDNPFVAATIQKGGMQIGGHVTLGKVMRKIPNKPPPVSPKRRKALPPPKAPPRRMNKPPPPKPPQSK